MRITNVQKKERADLFRAADLNLLDFTTHDQFKDFTVEYRFEFYSFYMNIQTHDTFNLTIFPVNNRQGFSLSKISWSETTKAFETWVKQLAIELNTPTGWETFQNNSFFNSDYENLNNSFTLEEKNQVIEGVREIREKVNLMELPLETVKGIDQKLQELQLKVNKLSKFDWKSLFIGTIANLIMSFTIPPEASGMLWKYAKHAFRGLKITS